MSRARYIERTETAIHWAYAVFERDGFLALHVAKLELDGAVWIAGIGHVPLEQVEQPLRRHVDGTPISPVVAGLEHPHGTALVGMYEHRHRTVGLRPGGTGIKSRRFSLLAGRRARGRLNA